MKLYLIIAAQLAIAAPAFAAADRALAPQQVAEASKQAQQRDRPAPPRQLSDQERAELRKQLQQFNQQYTRRQ